MTVGRIVKVEKVATHAFLGAASNVIIIHHAETEAGEALTFWEFARISIPLTLAQLAVYWAFLASF